MLYHIVIGLLAVVFSLTAAASRPQFYTAAVYDHAITFNTYKATNRSAALAIMSKNLDILEVQMTEAKLQGADIFVFPEYGLYGSLDGRASASMFSEFIPEPSIVTPYCPSLNSSIPAGPEVLYRLSSLARANQMYLAVNMADQQPCLGKHFYCPSNGHYQYNTEVVFNRKGCLIAKYHKRNLFEVEKLMWDVPEVEYSYFDTEFGRFGLMVCFDAVFKEPAITLVEDYGVTDVIFSTAWMNVYPHYLSVAYHSGWARNLGVNFLASNIHYPKGRLVGSGIYGPEGVIEFVFNTTKQFGTLLVAEVPVVQKLEAFAEHSESRVSVQLPFQNKTFSLEIFGDLFTFTALTGLSGNVALSHGEVHCNLDFTRTSTADEYALGAFDGMHTLEGEYYFEICLLVRCTDNYTDCNTLVTNETVTEFTFFSLFGSMQTQYVFPEVVTPDTNFTTDWIFTKEGRENKITGKNKMISSAVLMGRNFDKDPFRRQLTINEIALTIFDDEPGTTPAAGAQHRIDICLLFYGVILLLAIQKRIIY